MSSSKVRGWLRKTVKTPLEPIPLAGKTIGHDGSSLEPGISECLGDGWRLLGQTGRNGKHGIARWKLAGEDAADRWFRPA